MILIIYLLRYSLSIIPPLDNSVENADMGRFALMVDMKGSIERVPHGLVLIVGAWNYPVQLLLLPLAGAIAGGNVTVLKPSEMATETAKVIGELVPKYLDKSCVQVVQGGVPETTSLLNCGLLDFIFFTGSTAVGRIMYKAAAEAMIPIVLELGGKVFQMITICKL